MISSLARALLFMHVSCGCAAFYLSGQRNSVGKFNTPRLNRERCPEMNIILSETPAFSEGLRHATTILADVSASIPAVEKIPYEPGEISNFPQIVAGSAACVMAYAWAAYEFGKRIVTQRACEVCGGSGLVNSTRSGVKLKNPRKCYACGGFLPWENWGRFWQANMDVGNGGVLQRPAPDYDELNEVKEAMLSTRSFFDIDYHGQKEGGMAARAAKEREAAKEEQ